MFLEIIKYINENPITVLTMYGIIIILQIIYLFFNKTKSNILLFLIHKLIAFITIGFCIYFQDIRGLSVYVIAAILVAFTFQIILKRKMEIKELFLMGDINLTLFLILTRTNFFS